MAVEGGMQITLWCWPTCDMCHFKLFSAQVVRAVKRIRIQQYCTKLDVWDEKHETCNESAWQSRWCGGLNNVDKKLEWRRDVDFLWDGIELYCIVSYRRRQPSPQRQPSRKYTTIYWRSSESSFVSSHSLLSRWEMFHSAVERIRWMSANWAHMAMKGAITQMINTTNWFFCRRWLLFY